MSEEEEVPATTRARAPGEVGVLVPHAVVVPVAPPVPLIERLKVREVGTPDTSMSTTVSVHVFELDHVTPKVREDPSLDVERLNREPARR